MQIAKMLALAMPIHKGSGKLTVRSPRSMWCVNATIIFAQLAHLIITHRWANPNPGRSQHRGVTPL